MQLVRFKVQNYKRLEHTDWIEVDDVTAFVGGNESGKTAILQALWKLKPGRENIALDAQDEFPRRRYTTDYLRGGTFPVVTAIFEIDPTTHDALIAIDSSFEACAQVICTSYYDNSPQIEFSDLSIPALTPKEASRVLELLRTRLSELDESRIERVKVREENTEQGIPELWKEPEELLVEYQETIESLIDQTGNSIQSGNEQEIKEALSHLNNQISSSSQMAWQLEFSNGSKDILQPMVQWKSADEKLDEATSIVWEALPIFVYFDDYNLLESKIYIPEAIRRISSGSTEPRVRSQWALFELAGFPVQEIADLAFSKRDPNQQLTEDVIDVLFQEVQKRAIIASSAARAITEQFSDWWIQHRHQIDFRVDGEFFQIWVSDEKYPVPIEFEARSQGFRWFLTFYLVFMAETDYKHKHAILLLDEPGLHLYIPQQQKLLELFENLSKVNQLLYTTHSPFMLDSRHLERIRTVDEMADGLVQVSVDTGRSGNDVVYPIQANLGYQLAQTLFLARRVLIVEGETDYLLLIYLSDHLKETGHSGLPDQMAITFAGGNSSIRPLVAMMAPQGFEIVIMLDSDQSGRAVGQSLDDKGYSEFQNLEVSYYGDAVEEDDPFDLESILPDDMFRQSVYSIHNVQLPKSVKATKQTSLSSAAKTWLKDQGIDIDKRAIIHAILDTWRNSPDQIPELTLNYAEKIFSLVNTLLAAME